MHGTAADATYEDRGEQPAGVPRLARERVVSAGRHRKPRATPIDGGICLVPDVVAHDPQMGNLSGQHRIGTVSHQLRAAGRQLLLADFLAKCLLAPVVQPPDELNHVACIPFGLLAVAPLGKLDRREPLRDSPERLAASHAVEDFADDHRGLFVYLVEIRPLRRCRCGRRLAGSPAITHLERPNCCASFPEALLGPLDTAAVVVVRPTVLRL